MTHGANTDNRWIKERIEMTPIKKNMLKDIQNNKYFTVSRLAVTKRADLDRNGAGVVRRQAYQVGANNFRRA